MTKFQSTLPTRGSDRDYRGGLDRPLIVSIHAPHEGERHIGAEKAGTGYTFQSTLPTRGSDWQSKKMGATVQVSIHAPHEGERLHARIVGLKVLLVSIHAPHEGERRH